jgi:MFS family permease
LGGAVALLPIYAKDILKVGPTGLGWMQAAPAIGALLMSFVQSHRPPMEHAGRALLLAVTGFGAATIVFGLSRWYPLSLAMLFLTGALDNISVVVRHSLVQLLTPDEMRGRVSAINGLFISISNELGGFESGTMAGFFGPTFSVVFGGIGTLLVVAAAAWYAPALRRFGRLDGSEVVEPAPITVP